MSVNLQTSQDIVKNIARIAAEMPRDRALRLYEFAIFLESHPLPGENISWNESEDDQLWDELFASTNDAQLESLMESVEAEIEQGDTFSMFDEAGNFIERA